MGGFNPITTVLSTVGALSNVFGVANKAYNTGQSYQLARDNYNTTEQSIRNDYDLQAQKIQLDAEHEAQQRRDALRRAVSKQQAAFGAQGIDTTDGSGQAVLLGLFHQNDEERAYQDRLTQLKKAALEQDITNRHNRNLLNLQNSYAGVRNDFVQTSSGLDAIYNSSDTSGDN